MLGGGDQIGMGGRGDGVRAIQRALIALGHDLKANGLLAGLRLHVVEEGAAVEPKLTRLELLRLTGSQHLPEASNSVIARGGDLYVHWLAGANSDELLSRRPMG